MRLASLQKKRKDQKKVSRQHAGFGEQPARAPLTGSKVTPFPDSTLVFIGSATILVAPTGMLPAGSFARWYLRLKYD